MQFEAVETQFRHEYSLEVSMEPVTVCHICEEKVDKDKESELELTALDKLHDVRMCKNHILTILTSHFNPHPKIPPLPKSTSTWVIIVGIGKYKDDPLGHSLQDVLNFHNYLKKHGVIDNHVCLLLNYGVTTVPESLFQRLWAAFRMFWICFLYVSSGKIA